MIPVLLDLVKDGGDIARVHAHDSVLQHQRVGLASPAAHIAPSGNALVGVDPDEAPQIVSYFGETHGDPHIRDPSAEGPEFVFICPKSAPRSA